MKPLLLLLPLIALVACSTPPSADETASIRREVYLRYFAETKASDRFVYFVAESDDFIAALKKASRLTRIENSLFARYDESRDETIDVRSSQAGIKMAIFGVVVDGGSASAEFTYTATSIAAGGFKVRLIKRSGEWKIAEWKEDWVS
ncbi:MAG: hypothetical protein PHE83_00205 [Opitutaceae bacterium]|nr:hypothetical protein [Opitutaceae bacterium]